MTGTKRSYVAPEVKRLQFDGQDIMTQSNWNFNCTQYGEGDNAAPPTCDVEVYTDNSQNS